MIEAYGDSTTVGYTAVNNQAVITPNNEPAVLQSILQKDIGPQVTVKNEGVGGTEGSQLLNGTDGKHLPWVQVMANSQAQIVTLNFTLNAPYLVKFPKAGVEQETPDVYRDVMTKLVQIAKSAGKIVVLEEPNPTVDATRAPVMDTYVAVLRAVAVAENVPLVPQYYAADKAMLPDGLHPDETLYRIKAERTAKVIEPILLTSH